MADFEWTESAIEAVPLIAKGELTHEEIAEQLGVVRKTLYNWRKHPDFAARVTEEIERINESLRRRSISHVERRVDRANRDWLRLQRIVEARGADPDHAAAPGGATGLLCRTLKKIGSGPDAEMVTEFAVDVGLLKELRDLEKQAAQELKQWTEKVDVSRPAPPDPESGSDPAAVAAALKALNEYGRHADDAEGDAPS